MRADETSFSDFNTSHKGLIPARERCEQTERSILHNSSKVNNMTQGGLLKEVLQLRKAVGQLETELSS